MTAIAATVQAFFTDRLIRQRRASPHTIAAYRDTLRLPTVGGNEVHKQIKFDSFRQRPALR
jgi:hypothetical protein